MKDIKNGYVSHILSIDAEGQLNDDSICDIKKKMKELDHRKETIYIYREDLLDNDSMEKATKHDESYDALCKKQAENISFIPPKEHLDVAFNPEEDLCFTWNIYGNLTLSVYKPLILLKLSLFSWFTAATSMIIFLTLFLKHRGITMKELSTIYMVVTVIQFVSVSGLGVLADKLGRTKPLLILNVLITMFAALALVNVPSLKDFESQNLQCNISNSTRFVMERECTSGNGVVDIELCEAINPECTKPQHFTDDISLNVDKALTVLLYVSDNHTNFCSYEKHAMNYSSYETHGKYLYSCGKTHPCDIKCQKITYILKAVSFKRTLFVIMYASISLILLISYTSIFRFFDIISMMLVKEHQAEFGTQRIFSIFGYLVGPLLSGCIVHYSSTIHGDKYYDAAMYVYFALCVLTIILVSNVRMCGHEGGKKMWRKSISLIKNMDVLFFLVVVLVLGTNFGFCIIYKSWYFEDLKFKSYHIGLIEAAYNLYGLPFLYTSKWWINKLGEHNIFVVALVARAIHSYGYSFLREVWHAVILEMTSCVTFHLFWVAVMHYCERISPQGLFSTVSIITGAAHFTVGRLLGSFIGMFIMSEYGGRFAFRFLGFVNLITAVFYSIFLWTRRKNRKQDVENCNKDTVHT